MNEVDKGCANPNGVCRMDPMRCCMLWAVLHAVSYGALYVVLLRFVLQSTAVPIPQHCTISSGPRRIRATPSPHA